MKKHRWILGLTIVLLLVVGNAGGRSQALPQMVQGPGPVGVEGPFFVGVDINHQAYALKISDQPQNRVLIGQADIAAVGDFDNDGFCEVLGMQYPVTTTVSADLTLYQPVWGNNYAQEFSGQVVFTDTTPLNDFFFSETMGDSAVGDFDNDGWLDMAISGNSCPDSVCLPGQDEWIQVLLNKPAGFQRLSLRVPHIAGYNYEHFAGLDSGDFNGDDIPDLAAQHYWEGLDNPFHIYYGGESDTFSQLITVTKVITEATGGISSLVTGDFNSDGVLDVIVGQDDDGDPGQAWIMLGDGAGGFGPAMEAYDTNQDHESGGDQKGAGYADAYDFDGDGNLDIITAAERIGLLLFLGNGDGTFASTPILYNDESTDWFKVFAPAHDAVPCNWSVFYGLYLPLISQ